MYHRHPLTTSLLIDPCSSHTVNVTRACGADGEHAALRQRIRTQRVLQLERRGLRTRLRVKDRGREPQGQRGPGGTQQGGEHKRGKHARVAGEKRLRQSVSRHWTVATPTQTRDSHDEGSLGVCRGEEGGEVGK